MSQDTQRVWRDGKLVTFHPNQGTSNRGFIYVNSRRLYGWIESPNGGESITFRTSGDVAQVTEAQPA